jgi:osmotically-inducible protein OsmY
VAGRIRSFITGVALGWLLAYLLDPDRGRSRRARMGDMAGANVRRTQARLGREVRYRAGQAQGLVYRAARRRSGPVEVDDITLKHRIESEVLASDAFPGREVNITVVAGVAELRGQVRLPDDIEEFTRRVGQVPGVKGVRPLLHLPGQPAPNKLDARSAG